MSNPNFNPPKAPSYFQCPNELVDHWLPHLKEAELKILLIIIRKTYGWHKKRDRISISQLMQISGLVRESVLTATASLVSKGIIFKEVLGELGTEQTFYELIITEDSNNSYQSKIQTGGGLENRQGGVYNLDTQQQTPQKTSIQKQQHSKPEIFDCLLAVDVEKKFKRNITKKYDEVTVQHAVAVVTHPEFKISESLIQSLYWACNEKPPLPKPKVKKLSRREQFEQTYKHYGVYNGATCYINDESLAFERGEHLSLKWNDINFDDKLTKILEFVNRRG